MGFIFAFIEISTQLADGTPAAAPGQAAAARMTLKQLEAFFWAATSRSFVLAAERVHVTVSSLSKRIAELESSLGTALFDRSAQRAVLTDAGTRLLPLAAVLLAQAQKLREDMGAPLALVGACRFGVGELVALTWLPRLVAEGSRLHANLRLEPHVAPDEDLERRVLAGELDFAVVAGRTRHAALASSAVVDAAFEWCIASAAAQGGERPRVRAAGGWLAPLPLVGPAAGSALAQVIDDWLDANGATPPGRIECHHWGAMVDIVLGGGGIAPLPAGWAHELAAQGRVRTVNGSTPLAPLRYALVSLRNDPRPLLGAMRKLIRAAADFSRPARLF
jgi:DNA-binding transcriptional LysR family regulator